MHPSSWALTNYIYSILSKNEFRKSVKYLTEIQICYVDKSTLISLSAVTVKLELVFVLYELLLTLAAHLPLFQMLMDLVLETGLDQLHAHKALLVKTCLLLRFKNCSPPLVVSVFDFSSLFF